MDSLRAANAVKKSIVPTGQVTQGQTDAITAAVANPIGIVPVMDDETKHLYEEMNVDVPSLNETHRIMQQLLFTNTADIRFVYIY